MSQIRMHRIHEGDYMVEVQVTLDDLDHAWGPLLASKDVERVDRARKALRRGDLAEAASYGRLFRLSPIDHPHKRAS